MQLQLGGPRGHRSGEVAASIDALVSRAAESDTFRPVWRQLEDLDGWGTSAGVVLRFDAPIGEVPSGASVSVLRKAFPRAARFR